MMGKREVSEDGTVQLMLVMKTQQADVNASPFHLNPSLYFFLWQYAYLLKNAHQKLTAVNVQVCWCVEQTG